MTTQMASRTDGEARMKRKVLVADDDERVLALVEATLGNDGTIEVFCAEDGEEALKVARREKPDVIVLDVMMPKRTGYEVSRNLKRDPATAGIKIIVLTGLDQEWDRQKTLWEIRADDYIAKPFSDVALFQKVHEMLTRGSIST